MSTSNHTDRDAADLYEALSDLVNAYQFRDRNRICYHGISPTQCHALGVLSRQGAMRLDAVAAALNLDKSTTSRAIDSLQHLGYVQRHRDPSDGRALRVTATRKGAMLHDRIERELIAEQRRVLADLDPVTRRAAIEFVRRLARTARERFLPDSVSTSGA